MKNWIIRTFEFTTKWIFLSKSWFFNLNYGYSWNFEITKEWIFFMDILKFWKFWPYISTGACIKMSKGNNPDKMDILSLWQHVKVDILNPKKSIIFSFIQIPHSNIIEQFRLKVLCSECLVWKSCLLRLQLLALLQQRISMIIYTLKVTEKSHLWSRSTVGSLRDWHRCYCIPVWQCLVMYEPMKSSLLGCPPKYLSYFLKN